MSVKKFGFGIAIVLLVGMLKANAAEYKVDMSSSELLFKVRHMGINTITGRFDNFDATFDVDPQHIENTKGSATIDVKSINTNNPRRDGHLASDDFFNTEKFPKIKFVSKSVKNVNMADSTCDLIGDLTIRDVTKEITLKIKGGGILRDHGRERAAFTAKGVINRFDFNLKWNKMVEMGGLVVGPDVQLELSFEGVRSLDDNSRENPKK